MIVADTNHGDIEILRTFKRTLEKFAAADGTDVVMEGPSISQPIFDLIKRGEMTVEEAAQLPSWSAHIPPGKQKKAASLVADIMGIAAKNNMRFHAYETGATDGVRYR